jgi:hypothetical protein
MRRVPVFALLLLITLGSASATEPTGDRALLVIAGRITSLDRSTDGAGASWTDAWIAPESGGETPVRVRVGPTAVLDGAEFRLVAGDRVQVRIFSDEVPFAVQQVRNRETGRTLRLRCLHGEPLWEPGSNLAGGPGGRGGGGLRHRRGR